VTTRALSLLMRALLSWERDLEKALDMAAGTGTE
jgi:hypothetical protein